MPFLVNFLSLFLKAKSLLTAILGWIMMIIGVPYLALSIPSQIPFIVTGIIVTTTFFMGAFIIGQGLEQLESLKKLETKEKKQK